MRWWSRLSDRMVERELRESWTRAVRRAVVTAVPAGAVGALLYALVGQPWPAGALIGTTATLIGTLVSRGLILSEAGDRDRRR